MGRVGFNNLLESGGSPEGHGGGCAVLECGETSGDCSFKMAEGSWRDILKCCQN